MVVRVKYDRSNRVCIRRTGNRPSHAVAQAGGQFFCRGGGQAHCPPPSLALVIYYNKHKRDYWNSKNRKYTVGSDVTHDVGTY